MNFKAKEGKGGHTFILKFVDKGTFYSCRGLQNTNFVTFHAISSLVNEKTYKNGIFIGRNSREREEKLACWLQVNFDNMKRVS